MLTRRAALFRAAGLAAAPLLATAARAEEAMGERLAGCGMEAKERQRPVDRYRLQKQLSSHD